MNTGESERSPAALELPALVFCRSRKRVEGVARELAATLGWDRVGAYHAGLTKEERTAIEKWFFHAEDAVLVATCAYGMGVDKSNIRTTIHFDLPGNVEAFLQESGRAGRDGQPAESIVLFGPEDLAQRAAAADPGRRLRYEQLLDYCRTPECRRTFLMGLLGAEAEACFGCDNCRAAGGGEITRVGMVAGKLAQARTAVLRFLRANRRLLTTAQTVRILTGHSEAADRAVALRMTAELPDWSERQLEELVENLVRDGHVLRARRGPWKSRLRPARGVRAGRCGRFCLTRAAYGATVKA